MSALDRYQTFIDALCATTVHTTFGVVILDQDTEMPMVWELALMDGTNVGSLCLGFWEDGHPLGVVTLNLILLRHEFRHRGVARAVMDRLCALAKMCHLVVELEAKQIDVETNMDLLLGFYASLGFQPFPQVFAPPSHPAGATTMRLTPF